MTVRGFQGFNWKSAVSQRIRGFYETKTGGMWVWKCDIYVHTKELENKEILVSFFFVE